MLYMLLCTHHCAGDVSRSGDGGLVLLNGVGELKSKLDCACPSVRAKAPRFCRRAASTSSRRWCESAVKSSITRITLHSLDSHCAKYPKDLRYCRDTACSPLHSSTSRAQARDLLSMASTQKQGKMVSHCRIAPLRSPALTETDR